MIDSIQYNSEFLTLPFFRLSHFEDIQFVACQLLPQLVQNLPIIHILLNIGHDDSLFHELVIDPVGESLEQIANIWHVEALRLNDGALLVVIQIVILWRDFRCVRLSRRVDCIFSFFLNLLN